MTQETKAAVTEEEVVAAEAAEPSSKEVVVEFSEVEEQALERGWVPKDQWVEQGGDPGEWRSAKEFVERGELYKSLLNQRKELKQTQAALSALQRHHQYVFEKAYEKALGDLKREKREALREEDIDRVEAIEDEIEDLQKKHQADRQRLTHEQAQAQQAGVHPEFQAWTERNSWYHTDTEMREYADVTGLLYAQKNPGIAPESVLKHVEEKVKKHFANKLGVKRAAPNATLAVNRTGAGKTRAKDPGIELSSEEREIMNTFVKQGLMTEEEYIKELKKVGR